MVSRAPRGNQGLSRTANRPGVRQRIVEKIPRAALPGQSLLESNAVAAATMSYYTDKVAAFEAFLLLRGESLALSDGALLEAQILAYLDHLFLLGLSVSSVEKWFPLWRRCTLSSEVS